MRNAWRKIDYHSIVPPAREDASQTNADREASGSSDLWHKADSASGPHTIRHLYPATVKAVYEWNGDASCIRPRAGLASSRSNPILIYCAMICTILKRSRVIDWSITAHVDSPARRKIRFGRG